VPHALLFGMLAGLLSARLLPGGSCAVPRRDASNDRDNAVT